MEATTTPMTEKNGLSRMWKKVRAAFKDKDTAPTTVSSPQQSPPAKPKEELKATPKEEMKPETSQITEPEPQPEVVTKTIVVDVPVVAEPEEPLMKNDIDERLERARALFKKYNFDVDESEWKWEEKQRNPTERVQKTIRMRIKYTCHSCNTVFGHDKVCITCQHARCSKCVRYPAKKMKVKKEVIAVPPPADSQPEQQKCACHECQTDFDIGAEECPNCQHKICEQCLKEALVAVSPPPAASETDKKAPPLEQLATPTAVST